MQQLWRFLLMLILVLAVPIVPFVVLGARFEEQLATGIQQAGSDRSVFWGVVGILGIDILLPVPSSAVNTLAGARLGFVWGTMSAWLGMTLGACVGFQLARSWGRRVLSRLVNPVDLAALETRCPGWRMLLLLITRPLPIVAEAGVVLLGCLGLSWREFLPPVLLSHAVIAALYAGLGAWAQSTQNTGWVTWASVVLPLLMTMAARHWWLRPPVSTPDTDSGPVTD
jgi:3-dehydroquinate synthase